MEKTLTKILAIGWLVFVMGLLLSYASFADVHVYGEAVYTQDELDVSIFADITSPTQLRSAGVKLTYDPTQMFVASAEKNSSLWFTDNEPYPSPDTDRPGQVVVLVFKLNPADYSTGVSGQKVLLGTVSFVPPAMGSIPQTPTLGLDYGKRVSNNNYTNFVDTNLGALDDTPAVTFGQITITGSGNPEVIVHVLTHTGNNLSGVPVYAFTEAGVYTGKTAPTDENGMAHFNKADFVANTYKFRADYLSYQFWSGVITVPGTNNASIEIQEETTTIRTIQAGAAKQGVRVYLFNTSGSYLGLSGTTDENGEGTFNLPAGCTFMFRGDYLGNQFWSEGLNVVAGGTNITNIDAGGGILAVLIDKGAGTPIPGINVYLFNADGSAYLGLSDQTDENGQAGFEVCSGTYLVRADYMGYQFWSAEKQVTGNDTLTLAIPHQDMTITVQGDYNGDLLAIANIPVYLFTPEGSYLGQSQTTDAEGHVSFNLPEKGYKVRADYLSQQFWSNEFNWTDTTVTINEAAAIVTMISMGLPVERVSVYTFNSQGAYLGLDNVTDQNGETTFRLPAGSYNFRGDYLGNQYWSNIATLIAHVENPVTISAGGGAFTLTVLKGVNDPLQNVKCYLFNSSGEYLGENENTSSEGKALFNLADGDYKIRIDHMGYQFWTDVFTVPDTLSLTHTIAHQDVMMTVQGDYNGDLLALEGINVYLFTPGETYLGLYETTDSLGQVNFNVPQKAYKVRTDYLGGQYWSQEFTWADETIFINEGIADVLVTAADAPLANVPVYVFTDMGLSLGINATTSEYGMACFRLPEGTYKFRVDYMGTQYWATGAITAHQMNDITVDTGGGAFVLTVQKQEGVPISGIPVYVFTSTGSYLGLNAQTDTQGRVSFELADGSYKFRADYMGYPFWTGVSTVPAALSDVLTIAHQDVIVKVQRSYQATTELLQGVRVYLFKDSGSYLGTYADTNSQGEAAFSLPEKSFKVRADYLGYQFWSSAFVWAPANVTINHGLAVMHVVKGGVDVVDAPVYLFKPSASYLGKYVRTDTVGEAEFLLPNQIYKFRVDYEGAQYWSGEITIEPNVENQIELDVDLLSMEVIDEPLYAKFEERQPVHHMN